MISKWIEEGPGQTVEFITEMDADLLAETLVAFANSDGGTVVAGVDEKGHIDGSLIFEEVEDTLKLALGQCRPLVRTEWQSNETRQGAIIAIVVPRSNELHSLQDGRVLIRSGIENRPLGGDEIRHLSATKSSGDFET